MCGMLEPRREPHFPLEPLGGEHLGHFGRQHLEDDAPAERGLLGEEDVAHAAAAELALDAVLSGEARAKPVEQVAQSCLHTFGMVLN